MPLTRTSLIAAITVALAGAMFRGAALAQPTYEITPVRDGLYSFRDSDQSTVFLVTTDGIVLVDPLNHEAATWLLAELSTRFPNAPVRYVLHTHHHYDRAEGNAVFNETAQLVAHEAFDTELRYARRALPPFMRVFDRNGDGRIARGELDDSITGRRLAAKDRDGDGIITAEEIHRRILAPERTFRSRQTIELDASRVRLLHAGGIHSPDSVLIHFPAERTVFASHGPAVTSTPFVLREYSTHQVNRWLRMILDLEFETLLMGDGTSISRAGLLTLSDYLDKLLRDVAKGYLAGASLSDLQAQSTAGGGHSEARLSQIADMYQTLQLIRLDAGVAPMANYGFRRDDYCENASACSTGGAVGAFDASVKLHVGRRFVLDGSLTWSRQSWSSRALGNTEQEYAFRATRGTVLAGVSIYPTTRMPLTILGGMSTTVGDTRGAIRVEDVLVPAGGLHPLEARATKAGTTIGADLGVELGSGLGLVIPIRFTKTFGAVPATWPNSMDVQVGAGLTFTLFRKYQ